MVIELAVAILLAAGAVYFVLRPILSPLPRDEAQVVETEAGDEGDPGDEQSPRAVALRGLKELEFDRAKGKLTDADYDTLKRQYTEEALVALRGSPAATPLDTRLSDPRAAVVCPTHGPRPEREALFCGECGRRLGSAPAYCIRCGTALEPAARFCARCGKRARA